MDSTDRTVFNQNEIDDGNNNEEAEVEEIDEFFDEEDYDYENEDQEIELVRRLIILNVPYVINSNGLRCHIGFSESLHNGSEPGFKFYCGATVGQNDYHAPCLECDGRCGPTNGCQCTSCYALEAFFKRESERNKIYNKDGAPTSISFDHYHTNKFRHYCGRFVGQHGYSSTTRNNCCDGRCGPTNGCQCQACYEIDNHIQDSNVTQNIPLLMNQIKDLNSLEECDIMEHQLESLNKTLQNKKVYIKDIIVLIVNFKDSI